MMAHRDLNDTEQAFSWLGDALVSHVDGLTLDMLEALGMETKDSRRTEAALSHALSEVFDGVLVRQLLSRRAKVRREQLGDAAAAAADLKKLHDLSPMDQAVMDELAGLLMDQSDYKALVQLYEDQILRGKDMNARAELARKVARIWEEQLGDGRESADAWRRVLRMRAGDAEATEGLDRAKKNGLKKLEGDPKVAYAPPKLLSDQPVPPPAHPNSRRASMPPPSLPPQSGEEATMSDPERNAPVPSVRPRSGPPPLPSKRPPSAPPAETTDGGTATAVIAPLREPTMPDFVPDGTDEIASVQTNEEPAKPQADDIKLDLDTAELESGEIVIADDLADEVVDDPDDHTDAGSIVPPIRPEDHS
jgi:hypothetical protein